MHLAEEPHILKEVEGECNQMVGVEEYILMAAEAECLVVGVEEFLQMVEAEECYKKMVDYSWQVEYNLVVDYLVVDCSMKAGYILGVD